MVKRGRHRIRALIVGCVIGTHNPQTKKARLASRADKGLEIFFVKKKSASESKAFSIAFNPQFDYSHK
ncbi:MAG: hypothetical protein PPHEINF_2707 [uncultured Paraburkholderia sp.]|nr:MAG: hypothetical protein PPHEINF_2707 [uncultured Paraburkholderia sp.]CAH2790022.1 MAG: hypothetical protein PPHEESC_2835 [uncultured Paraburkholderia sp.]